MEATTGVVLACVCVCVCERERELFFRTRTPLNHMDKSGHYLSQDTFQSGHYLSQDAFQSGHLHQVTALLAVNLTHPVSLFKGWYHYLELMSGSTPTTCSTRTCVPTTSRRYGAWSTGRTWGRGIRRWGDSSKEVGGAAGDVNTLTECLKYHLKVPNKQFHFDDSAVLHFADSAKWKKLMQARHSPKLHSGACHKTDPVDDISWLVVSFGRTVSWPRLKGILSTIGGEGSTMYGECA